MCVDVICFVAMQCEGPRLLMRDYGVMWTNAKVNACGDVSAGEWGATRAHHRVPDRRRTRLNSMQKHESAERCAETAGRDAARSPPARTPGPRQTQHQLKQRQATKTTPVPPLSVTVSAIAPSASINIWDHLNKTNCKAKRPWPLVCMFNNNNNMGFGFLLVK